MFLYAARTDADVGADPLVTVIRERRCRPGAIDECIQVESASPHAVTARLRLDLACDLAPMEEAKNGRRVAPKPGVVQPAGSELGWRGEKVTVRVRPEGGRLRTDATVATIEWPVTLAPAGRHECRWAVEATDAVAVVGPAARREPEWTDVSVSCDDPRVSRLVEVALGDLEALRCALVSSPQDTVLAGGIPWFQTLFGRDAIWAAQMMLPLTWEIAAGTLRALASLQGTITDPRTSEQPGKILHEVRRAVAVDQGSAGLPPLYYGSIDATLLWIGLLADARRAGMPDSDVAALLPNLERALVWIRDHGDRDGDGFLEYVDESGVGLSNQGWKDSGDAIQFADGASAEAPVALVEVQAYAYRALVAGADLLETFGRPGAQEWRDRAEALRTRFHECFWVSDSRGPYLALALDGAKRPVDAVASNMGHTLGTGILEDRQRGLVAERLMGADLFSGHGVRTLSTTATGFWPLRYHGGSVWPHDSVLIATNLVGAGFAEAGRAIAGGLLDAAEDFDFRLPELFAGYAATSVPRAMPYPAACPVVCWSAAAAIPIASILGTIRVRDGGAARGPTPRRG